MSMEEHIQSKINGNGNGSQKQREMLTEVESQLRMLAEMAAGKRTVNKKPVYDKLYTIMNTYLPESFDGVDKDEFVSVKAHFQNGQISLDIKWNPIWVKNVEEKYPEMYMGSI